MHIVEQILVMGIHRPHLLRHVQIFRVNGGKIRIDIRRQHAWIPIDTGCAGSQTRGRQKIRPTHSFSRRFIHGNRSTFIVFDEPIKLVVIEKGMVSRNVFKQMKVTEKGLAENNSIFAALCQPVGDHEVDSFRADETLGVCLEHMLAIREGDTFFERSDEIVHCIGAFIRMRHGSCCGRL